jgi:ParB family chromosome partitioning protein
MRRETINIENILVTGSRRPVSDEAVDRLAESIRRIGLQHPVSVRYVEEYETSDGEVVNGAAILVAGRHRLEACKKIGLSEIECTVDDWTEDQARMWEIAENLHRAELTALERSEQIAEWVRLADLISSQVATKMERGRPEAGVNKAARELGISKDDAHRSMKVAGLSDEAKAAAREAGLENNRSALLSAASAPDPVARIGEVTAAKAPKPFKLAADPTCDVQANEAQVARLMSAWNAAGPDARQEFLARIDQPIMDRRFA